MPLDVSSALCQEFLELKSQGSFSAWLTRLQSLSLIEGQMLPIRHVTTADHPLRAIVCVVGPSDKPESSNLPPAADARAFGDFSVDASDTGPESVSSFCETARQVFQARPTRRFLHGFQMRGSMLELWMFDCSGAFSSEKFDIAEQPGLLVTIVASYAMMTDEEAGFNSFIQHDQMGSYVTFGGNDDQAERLYLDKPIAAPQYLVGPGTACYAAKTSTSQSAGLVVKFAWRDEVAHTEWELLELTRKRKVWGVIRALGCQDLDSIRGLREGLRFDQPYTFTDGNATFQDDAPEKDASFTNRTFSCVAASPLGWPINQFRTITELLEACRDVAKALRSLYQDGKILHRDICIKNLIIPVHRNEGDAAGILIDLDGALDLEKGPARSGELVGSEGFMAIGILTGDSHTYRHDLESLFYVFLWISICKDREYDDARALSQQPETSRLWGWCSMKFRAVARNKGVDMSPQGFETVLGEFLPEFEHVKGLAREFRQLLFPVHNEGIWIGSERDQEGVDRLYDGMIDAFNWAISSQM